MDYKYIEQLLERYWQGQTSLEEEEILRAFFSQEGVPASLRSYRDLFIYEQTERREDVLGDDFDQKMLGLIDDEPQTVKARTITLRRRLLPLFKAAAIVAIFLTLGNAAQVAFDNNDPESAAMAGYQQPHEGISVAMSDSTVIDTLKQSNIDVPIKPEEPAIILK
jgi:hypothetical protein